MCGVKLVKLVGEKPVSMAEKAFDVVKRIVTEGPIALWEMIKEKADEIKNSVMEGIRNWIITKVVQQGVVKILSMLNPAGAIVQAAMAIYKLVMWLKDNISRIASFVSAIFNSISNIASGAVGGAIGFIENAMARTIPIILDFLAKFLGLGDIGKKIQAIIKKIRKPIDSAINKLVGWLKKKVKKLFGGGKKEKKGEDKRSDKDKQRDLKKATKEVEKLANKSGASLEDVKKALPKIKVKYGLTKLNLIESNNSSEKVYAEINPSITLDLPKLALGRPLP